MVRFHDGVTREEIDNLNREIKATVLDYDKKTNYFVLQLADGVSVCDAMNFYEKQKQVDDALPDTIIG